jgi:predicted ATPase
VRGSHLRMLAAAGLAASARRPGVPARPCERSCPARRPASDERRADDRKSSAAGRAAELTDRLGERDALGRLLEAVRAGESRALVVRGDPGIGKTVLLDHLAERASGSDCRVARAVGMQSEMELAFAGLHQLCAPLLSGAESLPVPQRDALRTAFGLAAGAAAGPVPGRAGRAEHTV